MSKAAHAYLATQVTTTTQGQLLVMLYDAAIKFLKQAKERIEAKDYAKKGILISRAMDIISELANSLNRDKGGQLANNLDSLYMFCNIRLAKANLKMDTKMIDEVLNILENIRSAYAQIVPETERQISGQARAGLNRAAALGAAATARNQQASKTESTPPQVETQPKAESQPKVPAQPAPQKAATPDLAAAAPAKSGDNATEPNETQAPRPTPPASAAAPASSENENSQENTPKPSLSKSVNLLRKRAASAYSNSL
ncbi:MAG: flagellar export chaperone FliS [Desulfovibrio sp.]